MEEREREWGREKKREEGGREGGRIHCIYNHTDMHTICMIHDCTCHVHCIRESVDSLCRDGADMPRPPYIGKACTRPNLEDLSLFRYLTIVYESLCTNNTHKLPKIHR